MKTHLPSPARALRWLVLAVLSGAPLAARAGIEFETTALTKAVALGDESVEFVYKFKITGDKPVRITKIEVSCGCLEAFSAKSEYAAGESGEVKLIMKIGAVEGESYKPTTLTTNDPAHESIQLDATVSVPRIYEVTPNICTWTLNDPPDPKTIRVKVQGPDPINILKYVSSRENMAVEMKEIEKGRVYDLILTPKTTTLPELGIISLETDCKIPKYSKRQIFFTIVRPKAAAKPAAAHP